MTKNTNWYVVTGPPCSGKTTVINALASLGYEIAPEVARMYFLQLLERKAKERILADPLCFQAEILKLEITREERLDKGKLIFFDRALPDSIAYYRNLGVLPENVLRAAKHNHYRGIFYLDALPLQQDQVRHEDQETVNRLGRYIYEAYEKLGYDVINIPAMPIEQRVEMILACVEAAF